MPASGYYALFYGAVNWIALNVGKAVFSSFPFAALEVGMDAGIWKSLNLDINSIAFKGDAQVQQGMTAGTIDVGLGSARPRYNRKLGRIPFAGGRSDRCYWEQ